MIQFTLLGKLADKIQIFFGRKASAKQPVGRVALDLTGNRNKFTSTKINGGARVAGAHNEFDDTEINK